jgi:hypothetical protein
MGYDEHHGLDDPFRKSFEVEQLLVAKYAHPQKKPMEVKIATRRLRAKRSWDRKMERRLELQQKLERGEITEEEYERLKPTSAGYYKYKDEIERPKKQLAGFEGQFVPEREQLGAEREKLRIEREQLRKIKEKLKAVFSTI